MKPPEREWPRSLGPNWNKPESREKSQWLGVIFIEGNFLATEARLDGLTLCIALLNCFRVKVKK